MNRWSTLAQAVKKNGSSALASVVSTKGSTPRETDAWMIVTANGFHGSIGGGTVEWRVMAEAQAMLQAGAKMQSRDYVLGPDLGQCCGGRMQIEIEVYTPADSQRIEILSDENIQTNTHIYIFGAGHVGRALVLALAPLPYTVTWIDPRPSAFPAAVPQNASLHQLQNPVSILESATENSFVYVMTHSHALDFEIVDAALRHPHLHVGLIGSSTKRARFEKRLREADVSGDRIAQLVCPIGVSGIHSKHPAAIAASVVAQILQMDTAENVQLSNHVLTA